MNRAAVNGDENARLRDALARLIGAIEALAVEKHGGPPVDWNAIDASQDAAREALRSPALEIWPQTDPNAGRCESVGGSFHSRCGLPAGHVGSHTALIPTGAPWFPK